MFILCKKKIPRFAFSFYKENRKNWKNKKKIFARIYFDFNFETKSTYSRLASSWLLPLFSFQASHLLLLLMSNIPGLAVLLSPIVASKDQKKNVFFWFFRRFSTNVWKVRRVSTNFCHSVCSSMFSLLQQHVENQRRTLLKKKIKVNEFGFVLKNKCLSFIFCLLKKESPLNFYLSREEKKNEIQWHRGGRLIIGR